MNSTASYSFFQALRDLRLWAMLGLGICAGIPLLLLFSSLSLWLSEAGVERHIVTFFSWASLGYSFKFIWAPFVDRARLPFLTPLMGRRKSWLLFSQIGVIISIVGVGSIDPAGGQNQWMAMAIASFMLGLWGATQDIVIDAWRIEIAPVEMQALMSSMYVAGYRIGMVIAGAGVLYLASYWGSSKENYDYAAWAWSYYVMAGLMLMGCLTTLLIREPPLQKEATEASFSTQNKTALLYQTWIAPLTDFLKRYGSLAIWILILIGFYRVSDLVLGVIANVFYQDLGYSKPEIATAVKTFGVGVSILGGILGGFIVTRWGIMKSLLWGALLSALTNLLFVALAAQSSPSLWGLYAVIVADNLAGGFASAAFVAFLSSLTHVQFTGTQYALFSSLMTLFPKVLGAYSGTFVDLWGYESFFMFTALLGLPILILIMCLDKKGLGLSSTVIKRK